MKPWLGAAIGSVCAFFGAVQGERVAEANVVLPIFTLVHVDVGNEFVIATEDVSFGVDERGPADADLFFALAAPGAPRAVDATLRFEGPSGIVEEPLTWTLATRAAPKQIAVSGAKGAAGIAVHLPRNLVVRATAKRTRFVVRLRAVHVMPSADETGLREVRLGVTPDKGEAPALDRIEIQSQPGTPTLERAFAFLCSKPSVFLATSEERLRRGWSPLLTQRTPGENLCIQFSRKEVSKR